MIDYEKLAHFVLVLAQQHWATANPEGYSLEYSPGSPRDKAIKQIAKAVEERFLKRIAEVVFERDDWSLDYREITDANWQDHYVNKRSSEYGDGHDQLIIPRAVLLELISKI